jgi:hypothetical protein
MRQEKASVGMGALDRYDTTITTPTSGLGVASSRRVAYWLVPPSAELP